MDSIAGLAMGFTLAQVGLKPVGKGWVHLVVRKGLANFLFKRGAVFHFYSTWACRRSRSR